MRYADLPLVRIISGALESPWTLRGRAAAFLAFGFIFSTMSVGRAAATSSPLAGHWRAAETEDEKNQRLQAIDEATDRMGRFRRGRARSRLAERTSPPPSLMIEVEDSKVIIASGDRRLAFELGGSPIEVAGSEGNAQMSAKMEGELLIVVARSGDGERTTTYRAARTRLLMEVTMTGAKLAGPLRYVSTYVRTK